MQLRAIVWTIFLSMVASTHARGSIGLVVGEPFGSFGTMLPVGHAGIYLDHICADTPTQLRTCRPGENGVVISRYHDLKFTQTDWMAVPATRFFYGVDDAAATPAFMTPQRETEIREQYRQAHLTRIVPSRTDKHGNTIAPKYGDWAEGIGATYDRRVLLYVIDTTPEQDERILELLNDRPNVRRYTLGRDNCADFASNVLNLVIPGALHRTFFVDFDITNPKSLARQLDTYGHKHPELNLRVYELPQIPGTLRRSRPVRGSAETFIKTKRYLFTLIVIQPEFILPDWIVYETKGKWTPGKDAHRISPSEFEQLAPANSKQLSSALRSRPPAPSALVANRPSSPVPAS